MNALLFCNQTGMHEMQSCHRIHPLKNSNGTAPPLPRLHGPAALRVVLHRSSTAVADVWLS